MIRSPINLYHKVYFYIFLIYSIDSSFSHPTRSGKFEQLKEIANINNYTVEVNTEQPNDQYEDQNNIEQLDSISDNRIDQYICKCLKLDPENEDKYLEQNDNVEDDQLWVKIKERDCQCFAVQQARHVIDLEENLGDPELSDFSPLDVPDGPVYMGAIEQPVNDDNKEFTHSIKIKSLTLIVMMGVITVAAVFFKVRRRKMVPESEQTEPEGLMLTPIAKPSTTPTQLTATETTGIKLHNQDWHLISHPISSASSTTTQSSTQLSCENLAVKKKKLKSKVFHFKSKDRTLIINEGVKLESQEE